MSRPKALNRTHLYSLDGMRLFEEGEELPGEEEGWYDAPAKVPKPSNAITVGEATKQLGAALVESVKRGPGRPRKDQ